jgi:hypothetical protein
MQKRFGIAVVTALLASPFAVQAQGIPAGAERGAAEGSALGGPVSGAVGGVVGGVAGAVGGLLGADQGPRFHDYVIREHRSSYRYSEDPQVGMILLSGAAGVRRFPRLPLHDCQRPDCSGRSTNTPGGSSNRLRESGAFSGPRRTP